MMGLELEPELERLLQEEKIAWLTTGCRDGLPLPAPMWFLWRDDRFLFYSQPNAVRIRNIAKNPKVAVNLNTDYWGHRVVVVTGTAVIDPGATPVNEVSEYVKKYREAMVQIDTTPESMAEEYSTAVYVKPNRIRYE